MSVCVLIKDLEFIFIYSKGCEDLVVETTVALKFHVEITDVFEGV